MPVSRSKRKRDQQQAAVAASATTTPPDEESSSSRRTGPEPNVGSNKNSKIIKKNEEKSSSNNSTEKNHRDNAPLEEATTNNKTIKQQQENTTTSTNLPLTETPSKRVASTAAAPATAGPTVSSEEGHDQADIMETAGETGTPVSHDSPSSGAPLHETTTSIKNTAAADAVEAASKTMTSSTAVDDAAAAAFAMSGAMKVETAAAASDSALGESSNNISNTVQSNVEAAAGAGENNIQLDEEQLSRIRLFLSHRKLLLERVIQGRTAVQHRLNVLNSENPEKMNETDEQEVAAFAAIAKEATAMARKQTPRVETTATIAGADGGGGGGGGENINKRTSVSLRRGSSVGKRMNAALSSLHPGTSAHAVAAAAAAAAASASAAATSSVGAGAPSFALPVKTAAAAAVGAARAPAAIAAAIAAPPATLASMAPQQQKQQQPLSSIPSLPVAPPLKKTATLGRPANQKNSSRPPSVARNVSHQASAIAAAAAAAVAAQHQQQQQQQHMMHQQQQHQLAASMLYTSNIILGAPIRPKQPSVVLPQAAALRERRNVIQQELKNIMTQQQQRILQQQQAERSHHAPLLFTPLSPKTSAEKVAAACTAAAATTTAAAATATTTRPLSRLMQAITVKGCARPTKLPARRRTHWDYLLQEMQWTATDFIEERKWKVASCKVLANEIIAAPEQQPAAAAAAAAVVVALAAASQQQQQDADEEKVSLVQEKTCAEHKNGANNDEQQAVPMDCDDDVDDNVEKGTAIPRKEKKQVTIRVYKDPNAEDAKHAQQAARTASELISEFAATVNGMNIVRSNTTAAVNCPKQRTKSEELIDDAHTLSDVSNKEDAYKHISKRIDDLLKLKQTTQGSSSSSSKSKSSKKDFGIELSEQQRAAIDFVERKWNTHDESVGAIMGGPLGSGKTLATCALLWRHRRDGPHLVLCSPLSTFKWMTEIRRFDGLQVLSGNSAAWSSTSVEIGGNDVVVCEYDALSKIPDDRLRSFGTVIVDCRFPMGYRGSRPMSILEKMDHLHAAPRALSTPSWWSNLTSSVLGSKAKTLLVYVSSPNETEGYWDELPQRQLLECLALRMAFLLGTPAFQAPMWSIEKTVLGWSRKRIKDTEYAGTKFQKVQKLLIDLIDPFFCPIKDSKNQGESFSWELRMSDMSLEQRSAYDSCCLDVRGALAKAPTTLSEREERFCSMADALLRLRRLCVHANLDEVFADPMIRARTGSIFASKRKDSPSQPCHEVAERIMSGSGKLRDLISFMVNDAGIELDGEVRDIIEQVKGRKNSRKLPQKVAILAVLPEVQVLVSILLNALGISHEILLNSSISQAQHDSSLVFEKGSLSWAECQIALSKFNDRTSSSSETVDVLIASPALVAGDHGGIGVEAADHVVILDEDWSGRSELLVHALLVRCCAKSGSSSNCVRLVSAETCEHKFVSHGKVDSKRKNRTKQDLPWPIDPFGSFTTPGSIHSDKANEVSELWSKRQPGKHMFNFPGVNIFTCRGELLSEVLSCSKPLPRLFGSTSDLVFLPFENGENGIQSEIGLIHNLVEKEVAAGIHCGEVINHESGILAISLPPLPAVVAPGLSSQEDLGLLSMRHNFRCFAKILDTEVANSQDSVPTLPSDPTEANSAPSSHGDGSDETDSVEEEVVVTPREAARALLCYTEMFNSGDRVQHPSPRSGPRRNVFSVAFSCSRDMVADGDGNQGSEPLVYFPPLFPRLLESSVLAARSVESLRSEWPGAKRRASAEPSNVPDSKRPRIEQEAEAMAADPNRIVTEDEASRSDAASVLLDLADDYGLAGIGAVPLPRDSALSAGLQSIGSITYGTDSGLDNIFIASSAPCDSEEADLVGRAGNEDSRSMILFVSRKRPRGYSGLPLTAVQTHRSQHGLPGMGMPWASLTPAASAISIGTGGNGLVHDMNGAGLRGKKLKKKKEEAVSASAFNRLPNFDPFQAAQSAAQGGPQMSNMRDLYRSRLLAACRQSGAGTTLFEAPAFRAAVVRMRNKIGERLARHCWQSNTAFEVGPGLPLLVSKYHGPTSEYRGLFEVNENLWTSIVKRLKNASASTGDEALEISIAQRAALRRSLVAPCRVDFGPFQIGFVSSPSGMTAIAPPRPRPGVSLPMGVKVPQTAREQSLPWTVKEDEELHRCAVRFGTNWILAARLLSGYDDVVLVSRQAPGTRRLPRAARSCREHWQVLARSNPVLANEVRQSERLQREHGDFKSEEHTGEVVAYRRAALPASSSSSEVAESVVPGRKVEFLIMPSTDTHSVQARMDEKDILPTEDDAAMGEDAKQPPGAKQAASEDPLAEASPGEKPESTKKRRSFSAILAAKANRKTAPMAIPGMGNGNQPTVAPSHPSHLQAVQSSIAASWTGVRTDMWPLQLLDAADRQRASVSISAAAAAAAAAAPTPAANSTRQHHNSSSSSSNRVPTNSGGGGGASASTTSSHHHHMAPSSSGAAPRPMSSSAQQHPLPPPPPSNSSRVVGSNRAMQSFAPPPQQPVPSAARQQQPPSQKGQHQQQQQQQPQQKQPPIQK